MSEVADRIRRAIRTRGPIAFDEFMRQALYGPGGFYEATPVGSRGHFVTSPHVHPLFSRLVGAAIEELWAAIGRPSPLRLVEIGAGDGTMARELVDGFARGGIALEYAAVESSSGARRSLAAAGVRAVERLFELEPLDPGVVLANELLDNLPFRRVRLSGGELVEILVGLEGDRFVEVRSACDPSLGSLAPPLPEDAEAAIPTGALELVRELASRMSSGFALLIDYGAAGAAGEVHGYRAHRLVEDVLEDPGSADITAGVDLGRVSASAREAGLVAFEPVRQSSALWALGLEDWLRAELTLQRELMNRDRGVEAVNTWGSRGRARLLADAAGLGSLWWMVLATAGLPEPGWLRRARDLEPQAR